jgi:hypothetical protein
MVAASFGMSLWEDDMLKPAWYLPDTDWFAQIPTAPALSDDDKDVIGQLTRMLDHDADFSPATTVAATHALLLCAEHLGDAMTYAAAQHDLTEVARLLCGLTLVQAHLTQTIQRIAANTSTGAFTATGEAPAEVVQAVTDSLSTAGANGELLAGHINEAHLALRGIAEGPDAR